MEDDKVIDLNKPLMAKIYDFDQEYLDEEEKQYIVRKVDIIEFPCKHHNNTVMDIG